MRVTHCPLCGVRLRSKGRTPASRTVDHFFPKALGGGGGINRWPMCRGCNVKKSDSLPDARQTVAYSAWLHKQEIPT